MSPSYIRLSLIFVYLLTCGMTANAATQVYVSTAPPPMREVYLPPQGYVSCQIMPAGYYGEIWRNEHRVCHYAGARNRGVWVSGYWQCKKIQPFTGICTRWKWVTSHWENRQMAYGPLVPRPPIMHTAPYSSSKTTVVHVTPPPPSAIVHMAPLPSSTTTVHVAPQAPPEYTTGQVTPPAPAPAPY